jgi:hypothetical protein
MSSTYLDYRVFTRDLPRTLKVTAAQTQVSREADYYKANIGKVKTVDEFLKNDRLYNYAMRANGLTDMINSKAFMRKVLESDLDDSKSFARSLVDTRYQNFARAFNFGTDGKVETSTAIAQTDAQENDTVGLYSESRVRRGETAAAEVKNYQDRIGLMPSVDGFLRDQRLVDFAKTAYGFDPNTNTNVFTYTSTATLRAVLTSDLSDPESAANKLGGAYLKLAQAFGFGTDGMLPQGTSAQSDAQMKETLFRYYENTGNAASPPAAAFKSNLYESAIAAATSVDDIVNDSKMFDYVVTAFGLDPTLESPAGIRLVLTSDLSDPESAANKLTDTRYRTMAAAFNFNADGTVDETDGAQTADQRKNTVNLYLDHYDDKAVKTETQETTYFKNTVTSTVQGQISTISRVDDLINNSRLYDYLLKSYDLDPKTESKVNIKKVLLSDVSDPKSYANTLTDKRYRNLAAAVNFAADGTVTTARAAQAEGDELATVKLYNSRIPADATELDKTRAKTESTYYHTAISTVESVDELMADKRLVTYVLKAYGLDKESIPNNVLRQVLTSDPQDPKSVANKLNDTRYRDLAAAYNFRADGSIGRVPLQQAQSRSDAIKTADLYLYQTMETEAGNQSDGVRLALYFRRKAPDIGKAFDILADKALFEVVRTALALPSSMSQMDIDAQAKLLEKKLNFADFKDPAKVEKFLARFGTLYDQANNSASTTSPAALILGQNADDAPVGFSESLLSSFQGLRLGRV